MKRKIDSASSTSNPNFINYFGTAKELSDTKNSIQEGTLSDIIKNNSIIELHELEQGIVIENEIENNEDEITKE